MHLSGDAIFDIAVLCTIIVQHTHACARAHDRGMLYVLATREALCAHLLMHINIVQCESRKSLEVPKPLGLALEKDSAVNKRN